MANALLNNLYHLQGKLYEFYAPLIGDTILSVSSLLLLIKAGRIAGMFSIISNVLKRRVDNN